VHLDIIKVFFSPTDGQENFFKRDIKIYIKTSTTCFGTVTPSSGRELFELSEVTVVKICTPMCCIDYFNNCNFSKLK
jgi:hypothetical protein